MATTTEAPAGRPPPPVPAPSPGDVPVGPTLALAMTFAAAAFVLTMAVVEHFARATRVGPFPPQHQSAETALYAIAFLLILPAALLAAPRAVRRISATPNGPARSAAVALLAGSFAVSLIAARLLPGGRKAAFGAALVWGVGALMLLVRAASRRPSAALLRLAGQTSRLWALAAASVVGSLVAFSSPSSISALPVVLGAVVVPSVCLAYARHATAPPRVGRRARLAIDAAAVVLLLLAIPDLVVFSASGPYGAFYEGVFRWHHDFLLGPTNEVLHGGAVLVRTASQYGIGPIYLLAGWFQLVPIGYGMLGLLDGILFALAFAAAYVLLRLCRTPRPLALVALAVGVVALVYNLVFPVGSLPQHGPLRFGPPLLLILAATLEERLAARARIARVLQLAVLGLASVWALEAFAYTVFTAAAIAALKAWGRPAGARLRLLGRRAAFALGACIAAHAALVLLTLGLTGHMPDYGWYLAFVHAHLFGAESDFTYDFAPWSPGLLVSAGYAASAAALALLAVRRPQLVAAERTATTAIAGTTAYGIALLSYLVDRSGNDIVPYVSLPLLLLATLWLGLLLRAPAGASATARVGALAVASSVAVLVVAVAWSSIGERFPRTALAHLAPGGSSTGAALHRLRHLPPFDRRAPVVDGLLTRYMPGEERPLVAIEPDLETEALIRSGRANGLPIAFATEDTFVASHLRPRIRRAVAALRPGRRILLQPTGLRDFAVYRAQPALDPLVARYDPRAPVRPFDHLAPLQQYVLKSIGERFDLRTVHRGEGFVVAALVARG